MYMNQLVKLLQTKKQNLLNIYCTAGYPALVSTSTVLQSLQQAGADIIELGMPYSDPIADGPIIQDSNAQAIANGITLPVLFKQLQNMQMQQTTPVILMGYFNTVLQYGVEAFCKKAHEVGIAGIILPDLPLYEYKTMYKPLFEKNKLSFIFLITPQTSEQRIREIDALTNSFIYAVSSSSTTGSQTNMQDTNAYFKRLKAMKLKSPFLIGFGIHNAATYQNACQYGAGAIIGSAFIKALAGSKNIKKTVASFVQQIR
jgi:tryptophan synthase alpha chain